MVISYGMSKGAAKSEVLQGTLDLMVLKTLEALGPLHGYGIARRIEQLSEEVLQLNEGTVYTSLLRLQQQGQQAGEQLHAHESVHRKSNRRYDVRVP